MVLGIHTSACCDIPADPLHLTIFASYAYRWSSLWCAEYPDVLCNCFDQVGMWEMCNHGEWALQERWRRWVESFCWNFKCPGKLFSVRSFHEQFDDGGSNFLCTNGVDFARLDRSTSLLLLVLGNAQQSGYCCFIDWVTATTTQRLAVHLGVVQVGQYTKYTQGVDGTARSQEVASQLKKGDGDHVKQKTLHTNEKTH